jgi:glycine cleavage system aminomethyltransferase T
MRGKVKRSVRLLALDAGRDAVIEVGGAITRGEGEPVGTVTSAAYSDRAGTWLALVRLDLDAASGPLFYGPAGARVAARHSDLV